MIELVKTTIQTSDAVSNLFNEIMNQIGSIDSLKQIATIIGDIKTHLMDGIDVYERTPKPIFEWCDTVTSLLTTYKDQIATGASTKRDTLIHTLDGGDKIMNGAQNDLHKSSVAFNQAAGKLTTLENRLANDLDENDNQSFVKLIAALKEKVASIREFFEGFICTKDHITKEIRDIGDFKVQTEETKSYILLDDIPGFEDVVEQSAQKVITKCNEYRKKYE